MVSVFSGLHGISISGLLLILCRDSLYSNNDKVHNMLLVAESYKTRWPITSPFQMRQKADKVRQM